MARTRHRDDSGSITALEILGVIPLVTIVVGAMFQLYLVGQAGVEAESAARLTARELSKGASSGSATARGADQANDRFRVVVHAGDGTSHEPGTSTATDAVAATAEATVPFLGIGIPGLDLTIQRTATMPRDPGHGLF